MDKLVCTVCGNGLNVDFQSQRISCPVCSASIKIINNIPCFVTKEMEGYSEVPPADRETFLEMKRVAYGEGFLVSRMYNHYHRYAAQKRSSLEKNGLTVDIGFGMGEHFPFITESEKLDGSFVGIDLDRFKLEFFSSIHPEIPVLQASAFLLPFADSSVDIVQQLAILEHFSPEDMNRMLDETVRILKPHGVLIACYPAEGSLLLKICQKVMHLYLKLKTGFDLDKGEVHHHKSGARQIRRVFDCRADLKRTGTSYYPFKLPFLNFSLFISEQYRKV